MGAAFKSVLENSNVFLRKRRPGSLSIPKITTLHLRYVKPSVFSKRIWGTFAPGEAETSIRFVNVPGSSQTYVDLISPALGLTKSKRSVVRV
jgi:hypothetical protein